MGKDALKNAKLMALRLERERRERDRITTSRYLQNISGKEELEYDINNLKNTIRNSILDLQTFPNNVAILRKLNNAKEQLNIKEKELKKCQENTS